MSHRAACIYVTVICSAAAAQESGKPAAEAESQPKVSNVAKDESSPVPSLERGGFIGRYYFGDGLGVNCTLEVTKEQTFSFRWTGCLGEYDRNKGSWSFQDGLLTLHPEEPNPRDGFRGTATRLIPVKYGQRHYLIEERAMIAFCRATKGQFSDIEFGRGGRSFSHYLLVGDQDKPVEGEPAVPEGYRKYLTQPIEARVVAVEADGRFRIDKGRRDGVVPEMIVEVEGADWFAYAVSQVTDGEAICAARSDRADPKAVKAGAKVTAFGGS